MLKGPIIKYALISISVLVVGIAIYYIILPKINIKLVIYSDCLPLANAEIIIDGEVKGVTDQSGELRLKLSYDDKSPGKMVKINAGGQNWIEEVILDKEKKRALQERMIFFRQPSSNVTITPAPENISYSIMDTDTKCEIYDNQIGSSVKRLINGRTYKIRYSLDPLLNEGVFTMRFTPKGIKDEIEMKIFELSIITEPEDLFYEITENNESYDASIGLDKFFLDKEKTLVVKPYKGTSVTVNLIGDKWKYMVEVSGKSFPSECFNTADIRLSNPDASWEIINLITREVIKSGQGPEILEGFCYGKYLLKEIGNYNDLRKKDFIIGDSRPKHFVNLDLRRFNISVVPYPQNVRWEISKNKKTIIKSGKGTGQVRDLLPDTYFKRCKRTDGSITNWSSFKLISNKQLVELACFAACTEPKISIELTPVGAKWHLDISDGKANYSSFQSGTSQKTIDVELEKLYRLTAEHNGFKTKSNVISFTKGHKSCRETIDINMQSSELLLEKACQDENWSQVVALFNTMNLNDIKCSQYQCVSQAYSNDGDNEKALDILLNGWNRMVEKKECLGIKSDEKYIFKLLLLIERYGLEPEQLEEKEISALMDEESQISIINLSLSNNTKIKAIYIYLNIRLGEIMNKMERWDERTNSFKIDNREDYCILIDDFIDGQYSISKINRLMKSVGNFNYKKIVDSKFQIEANRASKLFGCN